MAEYYYSATYKSILWSHKIPANHQILFYLETTQCTENQTIIMAWHYHQICIGKPLWLHRAPLTVLGLHAGARSYLHWSNNSIGALIFQYLEHLEGFWLTQCQTLIHFSWNNWQLWGLKLQKRLEVGCLQFSKRKQDKYHWKVKDEMGSL